MLRDTAVLAVWVLSEATDTVSYVFALILSDFLPKVVVLGQQLNALLGEALAAQGAVVLGVHRRIASVNNLGGRGRLVLAGHVPEWLLGLVVLVAD